MSRDLLRRGGNWMFVAAKTAQSPAGETIYERLLFIVPQHGATADRPRLLRLAVDITRPTRHTLDVLRDMALPDRLPLPAAIYAQLLDAFNVEAITKRFYQQYARLFRQLVTAVRNDNVMIAEFGDLREVEGFVQRLIGRLMFLSFLQKKGWLASDQAFLTSQFGILAGQLDNYYRDFLVPLFFSALALSENERNPDPAAGPVWNQLDVPFLNGCLFEVGVGQDYELNWRSNGGAGVYLDNRYFTPDSSGARSFRGISTSRRCSSAAALILCWRIHRMCAPMPSTSTLRTKSSARRRLRAGRVTAPCYWRAVTMRHCTKNGGSTFHFSNAPFKSCAQTVR